MASRIAGITVEIGGDTTKLTSALKGVNTEIKSTQTALNDVNKLLKLDPSNTELLSQKQKLLKDAIAETKDKLAVLQDAAKSSDLGAAEQDAIQREIIETQQKLENLEQQEKEFGSVGKQQFSAMCDSVAAAGAKVQEVGAQIKSVGDGLTKYVTGPLAALGAAGIGAFSSIDSGYDIIVSKTGATGEALDGLKEQFDDIYSTVNASSDDIGSAIGEVNTRFHLQGDELEALSKKFIEYCKLNDTDVTSSVDNVQNALAAFDMDASEAGTLLDVLNRTAQNTGASVSGMETSLTQNATALQQMGLDAYQSVNFLGQLTTAGADSESVISGLKRALKEATESGVPFDEALANLEDTIKNGTGATDGLTAAYDLFGKSGAGIYQAVKNGQISFSALAKTEDVLADSTDSIATTYEETQDPIDKMKIAMNNLKSTGAELGAELLTDLEPAIEKVIEVIQDVKDWWDGLSDTQKDVIVKVGLVVAAIGPLVSIIGTVISVIGTIMSLAPVLGTVIGVLTGPIGLVVAAIAAAIAIGVALYKNWDTVKAKVIEIWEAIKQKVSNAINAVKATVTTVANTIKTAIVTAFTAAKDKALSIFDGIKTGIKNKIEAAKDFVGKAIEKIKNFFSFKWSLPKIKLPHFSISGKFSLNPPSIPHFSVEWYKKAMDNPMLLTKPTVFGASGNSLLAGGEAGAEVVSGADTLMKMISDATASNTNITITLAGDAKGLFNAMVTENKKYKNRSGASAFA